MSISGGHVSFFASADDSYFQAGKSLSGRFVASAEEGVVDWMGGFAVCMSEGVEELAARYQREHDDYHSIMVKALADRLAESFAERMHQRVRTEFWGYARGEDLRNQE